MAYVIEHRWLENDYTLHGSSSTLSLCEFWYCANIQNTAKETAMSSSSYKNILFKNLWITQKK